MRSKRPTTLLLRESINTQSWKSLRDLFAQNSPCRQNNTSTTSYNKNKPVSPSHLRNVEFHLQAEVANTRFHLQQEYLARTSEVEERAAASENAYANMHRELLERRDQLQASQAHLMEGGLHLRGQYTEHVQQLRRELQEAQHQRVLDSGVWHSLKADHSKGESDPSKKSGRAS